jgi:hypothetical protein
MMTEEKTENDSQVVEEEKSIGRAMRLCRDDFKSFVEEILNLQNQPFHDELDDDISQEFSKESPIYQMVQRFFAVITYPREHGKSTHLSIAYPLWRIAKDHNVRILAISRTANIAESFLTQIVSNIERNPRYREFSRFIDEDHIGVVPRKKPQRKQMEDWSGKSITIERSDMNMKDPTIAATGLFGQILSRRADIIILDDVVDQQNSATELQRKKVVDWIETTVIPVLVPGGTLIYLGNTWHMDDAVARFLKDPRFIVQKKKAAIVKEAERQDLWQMWGSKMLNIALPPKQRVADALNFYNENRAEMDKGWEVLWPDRLPYSRLYLERLINPYVFARMYQCDPSDRPDQVIRDEWIERALAKGRHLRFQDAPHDRNILEVSTAGMDLAISQKESADDTAIDYLDLVRYGYDGVNDGDFILRQIHRGHFTPNQQRQYAKRATNDHGMQTIRVESVGYQEALVIDLANDSVPVRSYHTGREKFDPEIGINSLALVMELGKLVIPSDPTDARTLMLASQLANEMRAYSADPTEHTGDALMALWFAYSEIRTLLGSRIIIPSKMALPVKDTPPLQTAEQRAPLERQVDEAMRLEQEAERAGFQRMMRDRLLRARRSH